MYTTRMRTIILLFLLFILVIYPMAKAVTSLDNNDYVSWNEPDAYSQCISPFETHTLFAAPKRTACVLLTVFQQFYRFSLAVIDIALFETVGLLPFSRVTRLGNQADNHHTWPQRRSASAASDLLHDSIKQKPVAPPPECSGKNGHDMEICIEHVARHGRKYMILAVVLVILSCLAFAILIVRYLRLRKKERAAALRKSQESAGRVGLGRDLGSDAIGKDGGARSTASSKSKVDQERDIEMGIAENGDTLIDSSWKGPITKGGPKVWQLLLGGGLSQQRENDFLAPPLGPIPPRIPTPNLPGSLCFFNDSVKARPTGGIKRKPLNGLTFDNDAGTAPRSAWVIPEIRIISTGSNY